jgi:hypothetical protein
MKLVTLSDVLSLGVAVYHVHGTSFSFMVRSQTLQ